MSKQAIMSEDLRKARVLTGKFPAAGSIKLHRRQCSFLLLKVMEALGVAEAPRQHPAQYSKLFRELHRLVHRVKSFTDDCCYKRSSDFPLAAIKVSAHKERFIKYCIELDWYIFLIGRVRDAKGEPVASEKLEGFEWKENVRLLVDKTRVIVEEDFSDFKDVLRQHVQRPGDHQKICATLLRRLTDTVVDDVGLEVPPFERKGERIGGGGFGDVYDLKWKGATFAIKIPLPTSGPLDREVGILEKCCHPNIVNLILFHKNPDGKQFLMMEKLSMNLLEYLESLATGSSVRPLEAVDMILQVCEGMEYLSEFHHVSHRDMKPENILVKRVNGQDGAVLELQVADFGLAKVREAIESLSNQTPNFGTTMYRAPEMTVVPSKGKIYGPSLKADMFSFAVTCSCILTGCAPYGDIVQSVDNPMQKIRNFVQEGGRPSLPVDCPAGLRSLLEDCWHPEPAKRPASFLEISARLRKLKAMLLTSDVHKGNQSGPSSPGVSAISASVLLGDCQVEAGPSSPGLPDQTYPSGPSSPGLLDQTYRSGPSSPGLLDQTYRSGPSSPGLLDQTYRSGSSSPQNGSVASKPGVQPFRILVLGHAEVVEEICMAICGAQRGFTEHRVNKNRKMLLKESVCISPPMCLYRDATRSKADSIDFTDIMDIVEARNKCWHQVNLKAAWNEDLYYSPEDATPFPNSSSRLHLVWYVCRSRDDVPNALQWGDITKKLNGVPIQMLVTQTKLYEIVVLWKQRFFGNSQKKEDVILVDLKDAEAKNELWRTCWEVKTKAEIKTVATIIGFIREQLGPSGIFIPVGVDARKSKEFSVLRSKEFILNFLCAYWEIPPSFVKVLPSMTKPQEAIKFVPFCLQDAATILSWKREHIHGLVPAVNASAELAREEAQACAEAYLTDLDFDACNKMKSGDVQGFLEAVFENRAVPSPLVSGPGSWSVSKFIERLRGRGHGR